MEIRNLLLEKKLVAKNHPMKKYIILFLGLIFSNYLKAQNLSGKYLYNNIPGEVSCTIEFSGKDFSSINSGDMGNTLGKGSYKLLGNKLIFSYKNISNPDSSLYQITAESKSKENTTTLTINVYDYTSNNLPFPSAYCILRDSNYHSIIAINTDDKGKANFSIGSSLNFSTLSITYIGYNNVDIPSKLFFGKNTNVKVQLKPQKNSYIKNNTTETYTIEKISKDTLVLVSSENSRMVFKKI